MGLETKITKVLERSGFRPSWDFHFEGGLQAFDERTAKSIVEVLNKSGEFTPAHVGRKMGNFVKIYFDAATLSAFGSLRRR